MKAEERNEDSSVRVVGREFIIIIVIIFSSLSFTLGFFVGKNSGGKQSGQTVATVSQPVAVEDFRSAAVADQQTTTSEGPVKDRTMPQDEEETKGMPRPLQPLGKSGTDTLRPAATQEAVDSAAREQDGTDKRFAGKTSDAAALYTVQLGALKNVAEARSLRDAYGKKGYKTYIATFRNTHNEKIYKVRAGEFREKREAEILALKLKKNDGLAAFVTLKNY